LSYGEIHADTIAVPARNDDLYGILVKRRRKQRDVPNQFSGLPSPKPASSKHPATEFALRIAGAANSRHANSANYSIKRVQVSPLGISSPAAGARKFAREGLANRSRAKDRELTAGKMRPSTGLRVGLCDAM
jgi:hypothetical protein